MSVEAILAELQELQSEGNSIYPKGIFPSQRYHPFLLYKKEDDNLFFTCSILRILQDVRFLASDAEQKSIDDVCSKAVSSYPLFRNKDGLDTYNFWQTDPSRHFPNGWFMHRFKHFQIPDDVDDTALVYQTQNADKNRVLGLREKLKSHSNFAYKKAFNPFPKYQSLKCYSTFFGKNMYIEFDVCVLSNLMGLILKHVPENELNEFDTDTLEYICSIIENNEHTSSPFYSAPNYPVIELIVYHVARLLPLLPEKWKNRIEAKVKSDIELLLLKAEGLYLTLIENSALKLGLSIPSKEKEPNEANFYFFHAGMITAFENEFAQALANWPLFHLRYTSKALNRALLIENMLLKRTLSSEEEYQ